MRQPDREHRRPRGRLRLTLLAVLVLASAGRAQDLAEFEARVTEFTLDNGLKFIVLERHEAPVVTCYTHADVGAANAPAARAEATRTEEDSMLAEAGSDTASTERRDPEEAALELLQSELGARRIDGG